MPTCFVMQPFDNGAFDQRYEQVYQHAIREIPGLEPYRVDKDPSASIPIEKIETGIRESAVCLAEITLDNPNVWFELGYAIACRKEVVLICSKKRATKFPFDVQHRAIIHYDTESPSDFTELRTQITQRIAAYLEKASQLAELSQMSQLAEPNSGFTDHEIVALAAIAQNLEHASDLVAIRSIQKDMETSGYMRMAAILALRSLEAKRLVRCEEVFNDYSEFAYHGYGIEPMGWDWILVNQHRFVLHIPKRIKPTGSKPSPKFDDMDDIPF